MVELNIDVSPILFLFQSQMTSGFRMGREERPNMDPENNKEVVIAKKQTLWKKLGEKIVAKSEMLKDLEGDKLHVCILLFLYCLQGIPLGLKASIPLILTRRSVPYTEQAKFTIASYPFSMKVLDNVEFVPLYDFWLQQESIALNLLRFYMMSGSLGPDCGLCVLGKVRKKEILAGARSIRHW